MRSASVKSACGPCGDRILAWCEANGLAMRGHCLLWEKRRFVQEWIQRLDDRAADAALSAHLAEVVGRYAGRIDEFDLDNEMLEGRYWQRRFGLARIAQAFREAQAANARVRLCVNDYHILNGVFTERYCAQIRDLLALGAPVGAIGCQGHFFATESGAGHVYDDDDHPVQWIPGSRPEAATIRQVLDRLAGFGLPVLITEYDSTNPDPEAVGADLDTLFRAAFAHPSVAGIWQWGAWKGAHWMPVAALYDQDFAPTPAGRAYERLVYGEWWTDCEVQVGADGQALIPAFLGRHRVAWAGQVQTVEITPAQPQVRLGAPPLTAG